MQNRPNMAPCKTPMKMQDAKERILNNDEVLLGYTEEEAIAEAQRCLNCPDKYCMQHCPASVPIPEFIAEIRNGNFEEAYRLILQANPLPGISSRVCPQECQCESHCTRGIKNEPVAIGNLERFITDWHFKHAVVKEHDVPSSKKHIAIVGSGPAGLTCAISLAESGFHVTIFEKKEQLGGVTAWGIPSFVLPPEQLKSLTDFIQELKIEVRFRTEVGKDISIKKLAADYDAVFVATGAEAAVYPGITGELLSGVVQANNYLSADESHRPSGDNVVVIGGGDTAIDAARTAVRSGAKNVTIVYRRTETEMPATKKELQLAKEEGVQILPLCSPARFVGKDTVLSGIVLREMELSAPDYPGGRKNVVPTAKERQIPADIAVLALGFENKPFYDLKTTDKNRIIVNKNYETSLPKVFAGGDAVTGPSTVMKAAAAGKAAAAAIFSLWV